MTDQELIAKFEGGAVSAKDFHHADHVRLAFAYLKEYPVLEALGRFANALKRFATAQGKENLYHETITWAYLLLIRERLARTSVRPEWEEFAAANGDLLHWKPGILNSYYTEETLGSDLARSVFLFPDRLASGPVNGRGLGQLDQRAVPHRDET